MGGRGWPVLGALEEMIGRNSTSCSREQIGQFWIKRLWRQKVGTSARGGYDLDTLLRMHGVAAAALIATGLIASSPANARGYTTGDWEGTANGFPASFQLNYVPADAGYPGYGPYGYGNLVLLEPDSCPFEPYFYGEQTIGAGGSYPVHANGSLGLGRYGLPGGLTGTRTARLSTLIDNPPCKRTFVWRMHPAHRLTVFDGTWRLRFANGQSQTFTVRAGGRLATGLGFPNECGAPIGGFDLFVPPNRVAKLAAPDSYAIKLTFLRQIASGAITIPGSSCKPIGVSARLIRRSR